MTVGSGLVVAMTMDMADFVLEEVVQKSLEHIEFLTNCTMVLLSQILKYNIPAISHGVSTQPT